MRTVLYSYLGHLQDGSELLVDSLLVSVPHEQMHRAVNILKKDGKSPNGFEMKAVKVFDEAHSQYLKCCKGCTNRDGTSSWA